MIRRPTRSTLSSSSAASDVYKRQAFAACVALGAPPRVLMILAATIVLWTALIEYRPGWSLLASLLFPFLGVWLLWGGSAWGPLLSLIHISEPTRRS